MNPNDIIVYFTANDGAYTFQTETRVLFHPNEDPWWTAWNTASNWCERHDCDLCELTADVLTADGRFVRILNDQSWMNFLTQEPP